MGGPVDPDKLGKRLRELRLAAKMKQEDIASPLHRDRTSLDNWENGRTKPAKNDLLRLLDILGVAPDERTEVLELWQSTARGIGDWAPFGLSPSMRAYVRYEEQAAEIFEFNAGVVPGLLQTEEYIRTISTLGRHQVPRDDIEKQVKLRLKRQKRLFDPDPPMLEVIITEQVLRKTVGDPEILFRQLEHLYAVAHQDNIVVSVLEDDAGFLGSSCNFVYLTFNASDDLDPVGYEGKLTGGGVVKDLNKVSILMKVAEDTRNYVASREQSLEIIKQAITRLARKGHRHD